MKILYCIHALIEMGGTERMLTLKANALCENYGYEVCIVTSAQNGKELCFPLSPKIKHIDIGIDFYRHHLRKSFAAALEKVLCEEKPDICLTLAEDVMLMLPQMKDGSIKMMEYHFSYQRYFMEKKGLWGSLRAWNKNRKLRRGAARMNCFIVLTQADKGAWGLPNIRQIPNPAHLPAKGRHANIFGNDFMAVGRLEAEKNFSELLYIWKEVSLIHPEKRLHIYGEGRERSALEKLIQQLGLQEKVFLQGRTRHIDEKMAESCALLMTSRYEGFPLALVESLPFGLPLISYNCPNGPAEIIKDGENGFLVPLGDRKEFVRRIRQLIEEDGWKEKMQQAALLQAEKYTLPRIMEAWDQLFKSTIKH